MKEESLAQPVFCMVKTRSRPNVSHAYAISLMFVQFFIVPGNLHHPAHCFHPSHRQTIYGWVTHTNSQKEKEEDNEKGKSKQYVGGSNLSIQKDRYIGQCPKENIWLREMVPYKLIQKMTLNVPNVQKKHTLLSLVFLQATQLIALLETLCPPTWWTPTAGSTPPSRKIRQFSNQRVNFLWILACCFNDTVHKSENETIFL